jgi:Exonuclease
VSAPIVVLDCETTGLDPVLDEVWEFAGIRREGDGTEQELHLFIEHNVDRCAGLPPSFRADHAGRWPGDAMATSRADAAFLIDTFLRGKAGSSKAHIVGAVPNFDTERLARLLRAYATPNPVGWREPWHYHLVDVENLAVGWLRGQFPDIPLDPPWDSELLSEAVGVSIVPEERHTAMGDVRWAMKIYDRVMKGL